jgi:predicted branched-subunit amino acid permease
MQDNPSWVYWYGQGMRGLLTAPAIILTISFIGFCAFASQSGIPMAEALFMTGIIWALPAKMILIGSMTSGAHLFAAFLAVSLSSIRLMPMVAALVPEIRTPKTPTWLLLLLSHFIAITAWVFMMRNLEHVPRQARLAYFSGFAISLTSLNMALVAVIYNLVSSLPPIVAGCLYFLTPVYFMTSIWESARHKVIYVALVTGFIAGPVMVAVLPQFDILIAGLGGGTLAFVIERQWRLRNRALA